MRKIKSILFEDRRPEITGLVAKDAKRILDVGCGEGDVALALKRRFGCEVIGIEFDEKKASLAASGIDRVIIGDINRLDPQFEKGYFDHIIFADVLEHLKSPLDVLKNYVEYLDANGRLIISVPNVRHLSVLFELFVLGDWRYRPFGIMDKGHLRFFTRKSLLHLLESAKIRPIDLNRIFSFKGSRLLNALTFGIFKDFFTAQYVILAQKREPQE